MTNSFFLISTFIHFATQFQETNNHHPDNQASTNQKMPTSPKPKSYEYYIVMDL